MQWDCNNTVVSLYLQTEKKVCERSFQNLRRRVNNEHGNGQKLKYIKNGGNRYVWNFTHEPQQESLQLL